MDNQGVRHERGNAKAEVRAIAMRLATEVECRNTGIKRVAKTFQNIGDYPKPVPKIGRPKTTPEERKEKIDKGNFPNPQLWIKF